jgi:hypothetical protein
MANNCLKPFPDEIWLLILAALRKENKGWLSYDFATLNSFAQSCRAARALYMSDQLWIQIAKCFPDFKHLPKSGNWYSICKQRYTTMNAQVSTKGMMWQILGNGKLIHRIDSNNIAGRGAAIVCTNIYKTKQIIKSDDLYALTDCHIIRGLSHKLMSTIPIKKIYASTPNIAIDYTSKVYAFTIDKFIPVTPLHQFVIKKVTVPIFLQSPGLGVTKFYTSAYKKTDKDEKNIVKVNSVELFAFTL